MYVVLSVLQFFKDHMWCKTRWSIVSTTICRIDDVIKTVQSQGSGCYMRYVCINIIVYADDILLLSPSVEGLQQMLIIVKLR